MADAQKIQSEGVKLLEEFSEKLKDVRPTEETHYVVDIKNVRRKDGKAVPHKGFKEELKRLAPRFEDGLVMAEKGN